MASKVSMEYIFYVVIDSTSGRPGTIAKEANKIAGAFYGDIEYTLDVEVRGKPGQQSRQADCVARATIEANLA